MGKNFKSAIDISSLSESAQEQIRAQIGDAQFKRLLKKSGRRAPGQGRFRIAPKDQRTCDGIVFDSKWELTVFQMLRQAFGDTFTLQPRFLLQEAFTDVDGKRNQDVEYVADFMFGTRVTNSSPVTEQHIIIDAKGFVDAKYALKRKFFRGRYNARIHEVKTVSDVRKLIEFIKTTHDSR